VREGHAEDERDRREEHEGNGEAEKHAKYFRDKVIPAMTALREVGDALENIVPQNLWPLPTYREMLFVK